MAICRVRFDFRSPGFKLQSILDMNLVKHRYEVEEVTDGAYKQSMIERALTEIQERWETASFAFREWKGRDLQILQGNACIMKELGESSDEFTGHAHDAPCHTFP